MEYLIRKLYMVICTSSLNNYGYMKKDRFHRLRNKMYYLSMNIKLFRKGFTNFKQLYFILQITYSYDCEIYEYKMLCFNYTNMIFIYNV